MRPARHLLCLVALAIAIVAAPAPAQGACYNPDQPYYWYWSETINVYVNTSGTRDVGLTGLTDTEVVDVVVAAMQRWNETSAATPRLRFAGYESGDTANPANRNPFSITVHSAACSEIEEEECGEPWLACTSDEWDALVPKTTITIRPAGCDVSVPEPDPVSWSTSHVMAPLYPVMLHELGHALGLLHSDEGCSNPDYGDTVGYDTAGVMITEPKSAHEFWSPWRDDIEGLRAMWGTQSLGISYDVTTDDGANWAALDVPDAVTRVPPTAGSAAFSTDDARSVAFVDENDYAFHRTGTFSAWNAENDGSLVDPSPTGRTYDAVSIAQGRTGLGQQRIMVAWISDEQLDEMTAKVRVATRAYGSTVWAYQNVLDVGDTYNHSKSFALGFDDAYRRFVLVSLDHQGDIWIHTLNPTTGAVVGVTELDTNAADIGKPACYFGGGQTWCAIAYASIGPGAPSDLSWIEGNMLANGTFSMTENYVVTTDHDGAHLTLAIDPRGGGSFYNASTNALTEMGRVHRIARGAAMVGPTISFGDLDISAELQPISVGLMARAAIPQLKVMRVWAESP